MAKAKRSTGCQECKCSKCGKTAHTIPNTPHRWCMGSKKDRKTNPSQRGTWQ